MVRSDGVARALKLEDRQMPNYTYLIVGGGMAAAAAIQGIRSLDESGSIGLIGSEPDPPYNRPPLTKGLWKGDKLESIWRNVQSNGVTMHVSRKVKLLEPQQRRVTDDEGSDYTYDKLLLATGSEPRRLPFGGEQIIYFRTLDDYRRLRGETEHGEQFAVIGSGFIGSEIAAALQMSGKQVTMVFPQPTIGGRIFTAGLGEFLNSYYREKGVEVLSGTEVTGCETTGSKCAIVAGGRTIAVDSVVAGIGVQPRVKLAQAAGLSVDNGIRVNSALRTSQLDICAAGDVASFHNPALNQWLRVEHEDNANTMGEAAGKSMAGESISYDHLPFFYSDLFDLGYEAVGELDPKLEVVEDWKDQYREGVVYYLRDGRVRGVLLWNVWEQVDAARKLIASPGPFNAANLKGRLPE